MKYRTAIDNKETRPRHWLRKHRRRPGVFRASRSERLIFRSSAASASQPLNDLIDPPADDLRMAPEACRRPPPIFAEMQSIKAGVATWWGPPRRKLGALVPRRSSPAIMGGYDTGMDSVHLAPAIDDALGR